jgi:hypothetical protein
MEHRPSSPKKRAESRPFADRKELGIAAVERLQREICRIYVDIDSQAWSASQKLAHYQQIFGVFASWFLGAQPLEKRIELLTRMAAAVGRADIGSAPRAFH